MRIRTSPVGRPAGHRGRERGFTLLELLVVLTIVALVLALIPGFVLRGGSAQALDRAAQAIADGLRDIRSTAIQQNQDALFLIDVERRLFRAGAAATPVQIMDEIEIGMITARQEQISGTAGSIRFFPDGSSTGGRLTLAVGGQRRAIDVDWLTGGISVASHAD